MTFHVQTCSNLSTYYTIWCNFGISIWNSSLLHAVLQNFIIDQHVYCMLHHMLKFWNRCTSDKLL